jgi:hypothetical protein
MTRRSTLRASDDDRERAADRLRRAAGEGRLLAEELEERLERVFSARTYGQLSAQVSDLPAPRERHGASLSPWMRAGLAVALVMGVLIAVAVATLLIAAIACIWMAWIIFSWTVFGRARGVPRAGHARAVATAARYAKAGASATRGGRTAL